MYKRSLLVLFSVCSFQLSFSQTDSSLINGVAKQKDGRHELAIIDFSQSIQKNATEVQAFIKKWDEYAKFSTFERAEKGLEEPKIDVAFARAYYLRGISNAGMKNNDAALSDFNTAIKIDPKSGGGFFERGKLLWMSGKKFEGCTDLFMARSLGDSLAKDMFDEKFCWNEAVLYYKDAISKLKLNQYDVALDLIRKSLRLSPDSISFYIVRGKSYAGLGKLDSALTDFDKALAALPNNADVFFARGMAYYTKKKYPEAFEDFDKAIGLNAQFSDAYLYRAYTCEGMNKIQSALYDYQQVQRLKPKDPLAFFKSGLLKNDNNDAKGACIDFKKAASLGSTEAADYASSCK